MEQIFTKSEDVIGGFKVLSGTCNWEYLASLKKSRYNRPSGDIDDNDYDYCEEDLTEAKREKTRLAKKMEENGGFNPLVKEFVVGILNNAHYKVDGQHVIANLRDVNEPYFKEHGTYLYDKFRVTIIDFRDDVKEFVKCLHQYNNGCKQFSVSNFATCNCDTEIESEKVRIVRNLKVSPKCAMILMFGNLSGGKYENLSKDDMSPIYKQIENAIKLFFEKMAIRNYGCLGFFKSDEGFIVIDELFRDLHNYAKASKFNFDELLNEFINVFTNIDNVRMFQKLSDKTKKNVLEGEFYGRKKWYKRIIKELMTSKNRLKGRYDNDLNIISSLSPKLKKFLLQWE